MEKYVDGKCIKMSPEEIAVMNRENREAALRERSRPLDPAEVMELVLPGVINAVPVDDNTALRMQGYYPEWEPGMDCTVGCRVRSGGRLWRCLQEHSAIEGWEPERAASLWTEVCESHTGAEDDPIPYEGNMALVAGLYYIQDGAWYRCIRDSINPVYHALRELVGLYVEEVI